MSFKKIKTRTLQNFSNGNWLENEFVDDKLVSSFYNFNIKNKKAVSGLGISEAKVPYENNANATEGVLNTSQHSIECVDGIVYFRQYFLDTNVTQHRLLIHADNQKLYVHQMYGGVGTLLWLYQLKFEEAPICLTYKLNGNDTIILSSPEKMVVWTTNQQPYTVSDVPIITSMCILDNVLFCTIAGEADKIWFSTTLNPELIGNTSEYTKYLVLGDERGYARKILTFNENVYVFRDYGITRINFYSASDINTKQVYLSDSKIFADTVKVCGDRVMFMTRDGVYSFDGVNVKKITLGMEHLLDEGNYYSFAECLQDKYYLALRLKFDDGQSVLCEGEEYKNNALLVISLLDFSYEILRGVDINNMMPLKTEFAEKMLVTFNSGYKDKIGEIDNSSKVFDEALPKYLETNYLLDGNKKILVRKVVVNASKGINVKVITQHDCRNFVTYTDGENIFETILPTENIKMEFFTNKNDCYIKQIKIGYIER